MNNIKTITNRYAFTPRRYTIKKTATIVDTDDGHFVFKKRNGDNNLDELFKYLKSRSFGYFPNLIDRNDEYDVYEYVEEVNTPKEQKALDMMLLLSLLHNKTTYFKELDIDEYKALYEDIISDIEYIYNFYNDIITMIENNTYMSPSEYLLARNISKVFAAILFTRNEIDNWYDLIKKTPKRRVVTLHNNLDLDHLVRNENLYLISWDKTKQGMPIYDLLDFYKRYALDFDFGELLKVYESKYSLLEEEKKLLFILMSIPIKISFSDQEIDNCREVRRMLDRVYKTDILVTEYYTEDNKEEHQ